MRLIDIAGEVCKILLPIKPEIFYGNGVKTAICTLASIDLLLAISRSDLMGKIALVARLFSENKGIDKVIEYVNKNSLRHIILCGNDTKGHLAGQALLALKKYGVDKHNRIINARGREPILTADKDDIEKFINNIELIDLIGVQDLATIRDIVNKL